FGTGVVLDNGLAVTALHNVADEPSEGRLAALSDLRAVVHGHGEVRAQLVAAAPNLDLAILRLEAAGIEGAPLALRAPLPGEQLLAVAGSSEEIAVVGATVAESSKCGGLLLASERKIDDRFFGAPIFDGEGRLCAMTLSSDGSAKAFAIVALRPLIDQAARLQ
ncbi:MAG TPA: serine protease, partial [Myxococcales bacterium]